MKDIKVAHSTILKSLIVDLLDCGGRFVQFTSPDGVQDILASPFAIRGEFKKTKISPICFPTDSNFLCFNIRCHPTTLYNIYLYTDTGYFLTNHPMKIENFLNHFNDTDGMLSFPAPIRGGSKLSVETFNRTAVDISEFQIVMEGVIFPHDEKIMGRIREMLNRVLEK